MAAVTAASWRTALARRLKDIPNARFSTTELDEAGITAFPAVFPKYWKYVYSTPVTVDVNGFATPPAGVTASQVLDVEDAATPGTSIGFPGRRGNAIGPLDAGASVVLVSYEPLDFPETGSEEVPAEALELLYLHAMATLMDSVLVEKTDFKGFEPSNPDRVDEGELVNVGDTLMAKFERRYADDVGMTLPAVTIT